MSDPLSPQSSALITLSFLIQPRLQPAFFDSVTGHLRAGAQAFQLRNFTAAALIGIETTAVEHAAAGKIDRGGDFAF